MAPSGLEGVVDVVCVVLQFETNPRLCDHPVQDLARMIICCLIPNTRQRSVRAVPFNLARATYNPMKAKTNMLWFVAALSNCSVIRRGRLPCSWNTVFRMIATPSHVWLAPATIQPGDKTTCER